MSAPSLNIRIWYEVATGRFHLVVADKYEGSYSRDSIDGVVADKVAAFVMQRELQFD